MREVLPPRGAECSRAQSDRYIIVLVVLMTIAIATLAAMLGSS